MQGKRREPDLRGLTLVVVAMAWIAGILLNSWIQKPSFVFMAGALLALVFVLLLWRENEGRIIMLIVLWVLLGAWRYASVSPVGDPQAISAFIGQGKFEVLGAVADEPKLQERSRLLLVDVSSVSRNGGTSWEDAHGRMEVLTLGSLIDTPYGPNYGDSVELQGKIQAPSSHSPPSVFASMAFPRISVTNSGGNPIIGALFHLRSILAMIISQSLPQPEAALMIAILLGLRTPTLKPLISYFNETGTAHLIAPSGFKVTLLAGLVMGSTRWLYEGKASKGQFLLPGQKRRVNRLRWISTSLVILSIAAYTILNGAGPAALRAGIMGILLVVAPRFGRVYNIYTSLAFAALVMSLIDPFVLWDAGFLLSFFGTLGIVLLAPFFQKVLHPVEHLPFGHSAVKIFAVSLAFQITRIIMGIIVETFATTLAAQTGTLPIFALTFNQISFIAPVVNVLTVPLLGAMIFLGLVISGVGLLLTQLGMICGWIAWPLLWYIIKIVMFCASVPGAYLNNVNYVNMPLALCYYGLLGFFTCMFKYKWPEYLRTKETGSLLRNFHPSPSSSHPALLSKRVWRMMQLAAALLVILAVGATTMAAQPDGQLTITFLNVGPIGQPAQGEAVLVRTPDGKSILIDGGLDSTSLGQELDGRLPFWQRSLDVVVLTTPKSDHLGGLQDIVTRYSIGEVLDAGMLHPNVSYALWRRTISERNLHYLQVRQNMTIAVGTSVLLQVLWPPSSLHKSSNEELDNALIVRLVAPGVRVLFLGIAALSKHALEGLLSSVDARVLSANIVQLIGEASKAFPAQLGGVLQRVHPSLLVITPAALSPKLRKAGGTSVIRVPSWFGSSWQVLQTAQVGTMEISGNGSGWSIHEGSE